jgi:hypothetical protein
VITSLFSIGCAWLPPPITRRLSLSTPPRESTAIDRFEQHGPSGQLCHWTSQFQVEFGLEWKSDGKYMRVLYQRSEPS